jgi:hypothetical protein
MSGNGSRPPEDPVPEPAETPETPAIPEPSEPSDIDTGPTASLTARQLGCFILAAALVVAVVRAVRRPAGRP